MQATECSARVLSPITQPSTDLRHLISYDIGLLGFISFLGIQHVELYVSVPAPLEDVSNTFINVLNVLICLIVFIFTNDVFLFSGKRSGKFTM